MPARAPSSKIEALGNERYRTTVYLDQLEDGDYFGLGSCDWSFEGFVVSLDANGVSFGSDMLTDRIRAQGTETWYVAKALFHGSKVRGININAVPISDYIGTHPSEFFSITVTAKERHDGQRME